MNINPAPLFKHTVRLTVPGEDALAPVKFTFRHKNRDELTAWSVKPITATEQGQVLSDSQYLGEVITDWDGPVDDANRAVPYSEAALEKLIRAYPTASNEIFQGYVDALTKSRAKNSGGRPGTY